MSLFIRVSCCLLDLCEISSPYVSLAGLNCVNFADLCQKHRDPSASDSLVLGLKVYAAIPNLWL